MLRHYKQFRKGIGIVRWHHERWDGKGYPDAIDGPQVPLEARIVSIADAFEAMTADRPYRKAMSIDVACSRLEENAGLAVRSRTGDTLPEGAHKLWRS